MTVSHFASIALALFACGISGLIADAGKPAFVSNVHVFPVMLGMVFTMAAAVVRPIY